MIIVYAPFPLCPSPPTPEEENKSKPNEPLVSEFSRGLFTSIRYLWPIPQLLCYLEFQGKYLFDSAKFYIICMNIITWALIMEETQGRITLCSKLFVLHKCGVWEAFLYGLYLIPDPEYLLGIR